MKKNLSILIIEDDKYARLNLQEILRPYGIVEEAPDIEAARIKLTHNSYDIVITDIELGQGSGVDIIPLVQRKGIHCIVVSSYENEDVIERAYLLGAKHYLAKFKLKEQLPLYIEKYIQEKDAFFERFLKEEFITQNQKLISDLRQLVSINWKNQTLYLSGPTGTGKSLLGKLIHKITNSSGNLVHLNCSEVPENLIEAELFGHEKGAFTGAEGRKEGKLRQAHGGTLFLDEVATMPLSMQQKLLKALDEKTFYPVGSTVPVKCEFTLITASCEDLQEKIRKKEFREDLFYRINGFSFNLPSLSQRADDIELLIKHYQKKSSRRYVIKQEAMNLLKQHSWPGNIRELIKVSEQLSQHSSGVVDELIVQNIIEEKIVPHKEFEDWKSFVQNFGLRAYIAELEKKAVEDSLKKNQGKITACIKDLKISSSAIYRIIQEHQLQF
jgi:DNA-binding NtrC family response regulator